MNEKMLEEKVRGFAEERTKIEHKLIDKYEPVI